MLTTNRPTLAAACALVASLVLVALTALYYSRYVAAPVSAGYGLYLGGGLAAVAALCATWALFFPGRRS